MNSTTWQAYDPYASNHMSLDATTTMEGGAWPKNKAVAKSPKRKVLKKKKVVKKSPGGLRRIHAAADGRRYILNKGRRVFL